MTIKLSHSLFTMKYPYVSQHDSSDCGAAALAMVCKYYKKKVSITTIRQLTGTTSQGTAFLGLKKGAEELGFQTKGIKVFIESFDSNMTLPAIAQVTTQEGFDHYLVVYKIKKDELLIGDPEIGLVKYSLKEFEEIFSGVLLLLLPTATFSTKKEEQRSLLSVITSLFKNQKGVLWTIFCATFLITCLGVVSAFFLKLIYDEVIPYEMKKSLYIYGLILCVIYIFRSLLSYFREYINNFVALKVKVPLLLQVFDHLLRLPYSFFVNRQSGDILTRFQDIEEVGIVFTNLFVSLVLDIFLSIITALMLVMLSKSLFFILLGIIVLNIILIFCYQGLFKKYKLLYLQRESELNSYLIEAIGNIEATKSFCSENEQMENFEDKVTRSQNVEFDLSKLKASQDFFAHLIENIGNVVFLIVGANLIMNQTITIGTFIVFGTLSEYFVAPVNNLLKMQLDVQEARTSIERLEELINLEPEATGKIKKISLNQAITFDDVTFGYRSYQPLFQNLTFTIEKGQKVAFIGESGSGKSTIAQLLMRFQLVNEGQIIIGNTDIRDIHLKSLRKKIGYISQNIELFSGTILENIRMGDTKISYEKIISICRSLGIHDFIQKLPNRYETLVDEFGSNLSGGEKQRIAIARAFLFPRDLYIFDEFSSHLDAFNEHQIQQKIQKLTKGKTTITIAHRLSTISNHDCIFYFEKGQLVATGNHEYLMDNCLSYQQLIHHQLIQKETQTISDIQESEVISYE